MNWIRYFKVTRSVWNSLLRSSGVKDLNAENAEMPITVSGKHPSPEDVPNARVRNLQLPARSFTIVNFRSARHFILLLMSVKGTKKSPPTNTPEDYRFARLLAGTSR